MKLNVLPISWLARVFRHDFLFSVLPQVLVTRTTWSNSNRNVTHFISGKCNSVTFQRSFFNGTTRIWNTLADNFQLSFNFQISQFKSIMYKYYVDALEHNYDPEYPRSWNWPSVGQVTCLSVFVVVLNYHMWLHCFLHILFSSGTTVIDLPLSWNPFLIKHLLFFVFFGKREVRHWTIKLKLISFFVHSNYCGLP